MKYLREIPCDAFQFEGVPNEFFQEKYGGFIVRNQDHVHFVSPGEWVVFGYLPDGTKTVEVIPDEEFRRDFRPATLPLSVS